jgi:nucleoside-diphosphate-sugar epimerase
MDMTGMGELGFSPRYDLTAGVADYVDWVRTHPA